MRFNLFASGTALLLFRYSINSIVATAADFATFHLLTTGLHLEVMVSTLIANLVGAVHAFLLLEFWVFKHEHGDRLYKKIVKFSFGVFLCTLANLILVGTLFYGLGTSPWFSRIGAMLGAGILGFWYNKMLWTQGASSSNLGRP